MSAVGKFLRRAAKYVLYPLFYLVCLVFFLYLSFPWNALKNKLIAEFAKGQASKGDKAWRLEIGNVSGYWFTGVELEDVRIVMPTVDDEEEARKKALAKAASEDEMIDPPDATGATSTTPAPSDKSKEDKDKPTESVMTITHATARARILPLLIGNVRIDFDAEAFGGEVSGVIPIAGGTLTIDVKDVDFAQVAPLRDLVGLPVKGVANGHLDFTSDEKGRWAKANGGIDLTVTNVVLGDGKAKLLGKATLPPATIGTLEISGKATSGVFTFDKFGATGKDVDIIGNGFLKLRDPWDAAQLDFIVRFSFSDAYKAKDDKTVALFGDPNDPTMPALLDFDKRMKKGKREDGFYGLRGKGPLKKLKWDGTTDDAPAKPTPSTADPDGSASSAPATPPAATTKKPVKKPVKTTTPTPAEKTPDPTPTPDPPKQQFPTQPVPEPTPAPQPEPQPNPQPQEEPQPQPPPPQ